MLDGVLICEIFSKKSSLNDLARLANFVPRKLPLCPDDPILEQGVDVPLSQSVTTFLNFIKYVKFGITIVAL